MNAKYIDDILNEKFTDESDPIYDMGIGINMKMIKNYFKSIGSSDEPLNNYLYLCAKDGKTIFVEYLIGKGYDIHAYDDVAIRWACKHNHIKVVKLLLDAGADIHSRGNEGIEYAREHKDKTLYNMIRKYIAKEKRANWIASHSKIKENLNEKFSEETDPIEDMRIGAKHLIEKWLSDNNLEHNCKINEDGTIDMSYKAEAYSVYPESIEEILQVVNGKKLNEAIDTTFYFHRINNFPSYIKFNNINANLVVSENSNLLSLDFFPNEINGKLYFYDNGIKPTEKELRSICNIKKEVILMSEEKYEKKLI